MCNPGQLELSLTHNKFIDLNRSEVMKIKNRSEVMKIR